MCINAYNMYINTYYIKGDFIMSDMKNLWAEQMADPEFAEYYDMMQVRRDVASAIFMARAAKKMSQKELSKLCGVSQGDISRFENEEKDANLKTLDRIARSLGCRVKIEFVPVDDK